MPSLITFERMIRRRIRLFLLRHINHPAAAFADFLQQFVVTNTFSQTFVEG